MDIRSGLKYARESLFEAAFARSRRELELGPARVHFPVKCRIEKDMRDTGDVSVVYRFTSSLDI